MIDEGYQGEVSTTRFMRMSSQKFIQDTTRLLRIKNTLDFKIM